MLLVVTAAVAVVTTGCRRDLPENPYAPNGEYFDKLDSAGERVLLVDADRDRTMKLRKRLSHYKVYDADMQPLGRVTWEPSTESRAEPRQDGLAMERLGADERVAVVERAEDVFELSGAARLERTTRGWAIYASDGGMMGSLERTEEGWELAPSYDGAGQPLRVSQREDGAVLMRGDEQLLRVEGGALGELELLMQGLSGLDPLERTLLGAWFQSRLDGEPTN